MSEEHRIVSTLSFSGRTPLSLVSFGLTISGKAGLMSWDKSTRLCRAAVSFGNSRIVWVLAPNPTTGIGQFLWLATQGIGQILRIVLYAGTSAGFYGRSSLAFSGFPTVRFGVSDEAGLAISPRHGKVVGEDGALTNPSSNITDKLGGVTNQTHVTLKRQVLPGSFFGKSVNNVIASPVNSSEQVTIAENFSAHITGGCVGRHPVNGSYPIIQGDRQGAPPPAKPP
jgi:hypothetical protein